MGGAVASAGRGLGQSELGRAWAGSQDAVEGGACLRAGVFGTGQDRRPHLQEGRGAVQACEMGAEPRPHLEEEPHRVPGL